MIGALGSERLFACEDRPRGLRHLPPHNRKRWDSSADTSAPLASRLAGVRTWGGVSIDSGFSMGSTCRSALPTGMRLVGVVCSKAQARQRSRLHQKYTRHEPKAHRERVPPQAISGSEADSMSRGGCPVTGRPHRSRLPWGTNLSTKPSPPERQPARTEAHRERVPPQALWKRSGQHEPRRVPGHGARSCSEVVFCQIGMLERRRLSAGADIRTKLLSEEDYRV